MHNFVTEREEDNRAWRAVTNGRYAEAIELYTQNLAKRDRATAYINRGLTWLLLSEYERAEQDFLQSRNHPDFLPAKLFRPQVGVALWLRGLHQAACEDWASEMRRVHSGEISHCDSAGGVLPAALLWWAAAHEEVSHWRPAAEKELRHRLKTKTCQRSLWPGTLAPFLLNLVDTDKLLQAATESTTSPIIKRRHAQAAQFYIGAVALSKHDIASYQQHLTLCLQDSDILCDEFFLANSDLAILT